MKINTFEALRDAVYLEAEAVVRTKAQELLGTSLKQRDMEVCLEPLLSRFEKTPVHAQVVRRQRIEHDPLSLPIFVVAVHELIHIYAKEFKHEFSGINEAVCHTLARAWSHQAAPIRQKI